ncbi:MAG: long-chain fatty acid--CoA ligase [Desulfobacterales bacterium]|nr:long-chain fatty acid--CoA ligase [Desulfobacterales bacterium]
MENYQNVYKMLKTTVDKYSNKPAFKWLLEFKWPVSINWEQFHDQVKKAAKSFIALGVQKGDKVSILSNTCYRWVLTDVAIMTSGGGTVGIYQSNLPKDCKYIINHSDSVLIFVEDEKQLEKLKEIKKDIPNIRKVILFKGNVKNLDWVISYDEFLNLGNDITEEELNKRIDSLFPEDIASIVYTSGTTGVPKGAVLTHDNMIFTTQSVLSSSDITSNDEVFLFLPLAHVFARTSVYTAILSGCMTIFNRSMETLTEDLKNAQPHWFISVPRIYEKIYSKVINDVEAKGGISLKIFKWAVGVGDEVTECKLNKKPIPFLNSIKYQIANALVFSKLQNALGGRVRFCISGAAPINSSISKFFHNAGILILEGIGMTENTSFSHVNRINNYRFGWVGIPGEGVEHKLADDGEVLIRGRNVMKEYYKMPEETAKTIDNDGWLYTGDIGEIDSENFLKITGRKKDIIITAGGKNVAPSAIEGVLSTSKYINQVCIVGDNYKYLTALVTLEPDNIKQYAEQNGIKFENIDDLIENKAIINLIESEIMQKNKEFASFETIKKIKIVPNFSIENGFLTPTLKLKKNLIIKQYQNKIEEMYK